MNSKLLLLSVSAFLSTLVLSCTGCNSDEWSYDDEPATYDFGSIPEGDVIINGSTLDEKTLGEFVEVYQARPLPGTYWYDAVSGMWGRVGMPAEGFLYAGHDFGPVPLDASGGTSGVVLNGRSLHDVEVTSLSAMAGYVLPGNYWLDAMGNYGFEGNPMPAGNLYMLSGAGAGSGTGGGGTGGGGDNTWSSQYSSGNYDSNSGAGYVQLPNGGFVGHGM